MRRNAWMLWFSSASTRAGSWRASKPTASARQTTCCRMLASVRERATHSLLTENESKPGGLVALALALLAAASATQKPVVLEARIDGTLQRRHALLLGELGVERRRGLGSKLVAVLDFLGRHHCSTSKSSRTASSAAGLTASRA